MWEPTSCKPKLEVDMQSVNIMSPESQSGVISPEAFFVVILPDECSVQGVCGVRLPGPLPLAGCFDRSRHKQPLQWLHYGDLAAHELSLLQADLVVLDLYGVRLEYVL